VQRAREQPGAILWPSFIVAGAARRSSAVFDPHELTLFGSRSSFRTAMYSVGFLF
jgi:hypothetical protein